MNRINYIQAFQIRSKTWEKDWELLIKSLPKGIDISNWALKIFEQGLKETVRSIILEPFYICKDHRNLYSNFYSKKFIERTRYSSRLHFFSKENVSVPELLFDQEKYQDHYLGFSVIRPVEERCIGRTIIDPLKLKSIDKNNFFCLRTKYDVHISGRKFSVLGFPYLSQDGDVTVCAHTALWSVCRYLSESYSKYREVYPFDLITQTGTSLGRTYPYRGMTYQDYSQILSAFGTFPTIIRLKTERKQKKINNKEFLNLYSYVESGFPVLTSYGGHAVVIIGHTIDYEKNNYHDSKIINSSHFLKELIVIDDNCFPYRLLGYKKNYSYGHKINDITNVVCPLPEKVFLPAELARDISVEILLDKKIKSQIKKIASTPWVTRLFLTTNQSFNPNYS